jgi:hypothetical protein
VFDESSRFCIDLRQSGSVRESFQWGTPGNEANSGVSPTNGWYLGQRSSPTSRAIWRDRQRLATNTTPDSASAVPATTIQIFNAGAVSLSPWAGCSTCAGMTDGTMTDDEVAELYDILYNKLFIPTGRV